MDDYMKCKSVKLLSENARDKVVEGVDIVANAVKVTMGPAGRLVLYNGDFGTMGVTKDGVTVARNIKLKDNEQNLGAALIKQSANQTLKGVGDGTTTTCVLAQSIIHSGLDAANSGNNIINITRELKNIVDTVIIPELEENIRTMEDDEIIESTARMSTNQDEELTNVTTEVFKKYGKDIVVNIETSDTGKTHVSVVPGISINRGYTRPEFAPANSPVTKFENCGILLIDDKVTNPQLLFTRVIQNYFKQPPVLPLLIIAKDFPESFEADLFRNRANGIPILPVRAPYYGQKQKDYLKDIAVFTGGKIISEDDGVPLAQADTSVIGVSEMVMVDMKSTSIINSHKSDELDSYIEELREKLSNTDNDYDKENIKERISKLVAGICSIKVYAETDAELQEKKDRLDDAIRAIKVALERGLCPGGGSLFYKISKKLEDSYFSLDNDNQKIARNILSKALKEPLYQLIRNSGDNPYEVLLSRTNTWEDVCYDILKKRFVNISTTDILDPVGVLESSLKNAVSIAVAVLSIGAVISDLPEDNASKTTNSSINY